MEHQSNTKIKLLLLLIILTVLCSCCSLNVWDYGHVECKEIPQEAVDIAIKDFSRRIRSRKNTNRATVNVLINYTSADWFEVAMLLRRDDADKFPLSELQENVGTVPPSWIPTDYVEKGNVLYIWHNPKKALTEDIVEKLYIYNRVLREDEDWIVMLDGSYTSYIFCKYNYKKRYYRRVVASYSTPFPTCGCH